ncbi:putative CCR4-NOT core complex subunit Not4 [Aspergillus carlsbadensis]|nr:putative CCR4-NOT core complex subunit Not4 [Aspergillus carlsbadensis]
MSNRLQSDSVIDDDDEFCPLCIEEFDLSDKNFRPCPCGYQICQFCYNNIKTHSEEGRCPNCRRVYDESTIQYKVPDADEFKADLALKHRKAAAAKKKEAEKREIEASSRKNLAGVRVVQKNLVYVIGLNPTIRDENQLLQLLRTPTYFGQYGEIEKIVVSKAKPGGNPNQGIGVYVTYARKIDAATCINAVDGSSNGDRILRAQYGTTKYCSSFLRNEQCHNRNCTFLHETGEDSDSYSRQDLSSMNTLSSQRPNGVTGSPIATVLPHIARTSAQPIAQTLRRQPSKDDAGRPLDGPALPSSASWANKDSAINRTRRASLTGSQASQSPRSALATVATPSDDSKRSEKQTPSMQPQERLETPTPSDAPSSVPPPSTPARPPVEEDTPLLDNLVKAVNSPSFKFIFSTASLSPEDVALIDNHPSFIDPYGGVKRRAMREKAEQERTKREQELLQSTTAEDEGRESGSLQLGGEPDDANPPRGRVSRESHGAIQPPSQQGTTTSSAVGSPVSAAGHQFQGINLNTRSLTPLQQQQLMLLRSAGSQQANQQAGLSDPVQAAISSATPEQALQARQGLLQSQAAQLNALQAQNRQNSRFSFNDIGAKNLPNSRILNQQMSSLMQSASLNPLAAPSPQHALGNNFYTSGVQGPPPGLKTAGTPPISGGGMFAQGHGFTSNAGLGGLSGKQEAHPELMRELLRSRSGTNASGLQGQDKRELMFPFLQHHQTPPPLTPVNGLLSSAYGTQAGISSESGAQKQRKKGKKHRHANTSSGGGGVVDLADPSILQARMPQVGANAVASQGLYGSQGQVDEDFPPLGATTKDKRSVDSFGALMRSQLMSDSYPLGRTGTPSLPPGLPLPQGHAGSALFQGGLKSPSLDSSITGPPGFDIPSPSVAESPTPNDDVPEPDPKEVSQSKPSRTKNAAEISLGSPVAKAATRVRAAPKEEPSPAPEKKSETKASAGSTKSKPMKLDLSFNVSPNVSPLPELPSKPEPSAHVLSAHAPALALALDSRPDTPMTGMSRASESPAPRQPRVLRVVDTPKAETPPPPVSAAQSVASFPINKVRSRRPSISSQSRPDTPGDFGSEADLYTSTSASRANSPPASSRIGSAPVRSITKSQLKKERKQKAKDAEAKKQEVASVSEEPIQAPIIGRKRKTKKAPTEAPNPPSESASTSKPSVTVSNEESEKAEPVKKSKPSEPAPVPESNPPTPSERKTPVEQKQPEPWRSKNTVEQLLKDAESTGVSLKELFAERTSPLQVLLSQLHKSGALDLNHHPLFNPSNLSQRFDMKCTSDDYDELKQPIELTEQHRKALLRGEPIRFASETNSLKDRCLISPRGCILHHLSPEEEDRYLAIEKSISWAIDAFQEYPSIPITEPDATNRGGGLDALFATPENFNVCWVDETSAGALSPSSPTSALSPTEAALASAPPNVLSAMEADSTRSHNWAIANTAEIMNATATSVRSFAAATAKHMLGAAGVVMGNLPDLDDVVGMTDEELRTFTVKSQKELEASRKELDAIDKKLSALVKRNKKLAQQALAT